MSVTTCKFFEIMQVRNDWPFCTLIKKLGREGVGNHLISFHF